jgi:hypothetical protein
MTRRTSLILLAAVAAAVALVPAAVHKDITATNDLIVLFALEPLVALGAVAACLAYLARHPESARGMMGVGISILLTGTALMTLFVIWLPEDNTILGTALVGGLLVMCGTALALAGSLIVAGVHQGGAIPVGIAAGVVAFLVATSGAVIAPLAPLRPQVAVALIVLIVSAGLALRRPDVLAPMLAGVLVAGLTVALIVVRGPDDWASASQTLKLYSFPALALCGLLDLLILDLWRDDSRSTAGHVTA